MSSKNVVLVAGVHGVSGRAAATAWANTRDTKVYGLSRRNADLPEGVEGITVDLLDRQDVERPAGKRSPELKTPISTSMHLSWRH